MSVLSKLFRSVALCSAKQPTNCSPWSRSRELFLVLRQNSFFPKGPYQLPKGASCSLKGQIHRFPEGNCCCLEKQVCFPGGNCCCLERQVCFPGGNCSCLERQVCFPKGNSSEKYNHPRMLCLLPDSVCGPSRAAQLLAHETQTGGHDGYMSRVSGKPE